MKKNANIQLQHYYTAKVTNKVVTIQILASSPKGGWEAVNLATGKKVHIQGSERLIKEVKGNSAAPVSKETKKPKSTSSKASKKDKKLSILDAAAKVLATESPLNCKQLIERMTEAGLWKSVAATPANTLHAAISKEIRFKGGQSRFEKAGRGQFDLKARK